MTDWEARLAAEGLAPVVLGNGASVRQLELCTDPFIGAGAPDAEQVALYRAHLRWMPESAAAVVGTS